MIRLLFPLLCCASFVFAQERKAGERPVLREPSIDKKIFGEKSPEKFFEERLKDEKCKADLESAETKHRNARKKLRELLAKKADASKVETAEKDWLKARAELLPIVEKCGPCATRPVEYDKVRGKNGVEHWYMADGSCWVGKPNKYEDASTALEKLSRYERKDDGFTALMTFRAFDKDGNAIPQDKRLPVEDAKDPTFVFMGLRADPGIGLTMVYTHLFQSEFRRREEGRWIVMRTPNTQEPKPAEGERTVPIVVPTITEPELKDLSLAGKEQRIQRSRVREAWGTWYVTRDGYVRYQNAGDFGAAVLFLNREGRKIVQDVLYEMVERMRGE